VIEIVEAAHLQQNLKIVNHITQRESVQANPNIKMVFPRRLSTIGGSLSIGLSFLWASVNIFYRRHIPLVIGGVIVGLNIFWIGELINLTTVPGSDGFPLFLSLSVLGPALLLCNEMPEKE
jgi:hypothetical protein